ncbi:MAG: 2Fe-2S iron-sulfur cluster-binding protein [Oscillospiraceae bacterium]
MERAGINARRLCRSGECGWCHSRLVSGEVYVPPRSTAAAWPTRSSAGYTPASATRSATSPSRCSHRVSDNETASGSPEAVFYLSMSAYFFRTASRSSPGFSATLAKVRFSPCRRA